MKRFLVVFAVCLCFVLGISYVVTSYIIMPAKLEVVEVATTTSQNKIIQQRLKNWGYYTGAIDGILGSKSVTAIKKFQRNNGLVVDGIVGSKTAAAIGISITSLKSQSSVTSIS